MEMILVLISSIFAVILIFPIINGGFNTNNGLKIWGWLICIFVLIIGICVTLYRVTDPEKLYKKINVEPIEKTAIVKIKYLTCQYAPYSIDDKCKINSTYIIKLTDFIEIIKSNSKIAENENTDGK